MKRFISILSLSICSAAFAGGTIGGGGSGSSKAALELASIAFSLDHLPEIRVDADTLRRAEARLSIGGAESVEMPVEGSPVSVRKLRSAVVDTEITKRFIAE